MSAHAVYRSEEPCWKCGTVLVRIEPPIYGWHYYCARCEHLTSPRAELEAAMATKSEAAVGIVAAWPIHLDIEYTP